VPFWMAGPSSSESWDENGSSGYPSFYDFVRDHRAVVTPSDPLQGGEYAGRLRRGPRTQRRCRTQHQPNQEATRHGRSGPGLSPARQAAPFELRPAWSRHRRRTFSSGTSAIQRPSTSRSSSNSELHGHSLACSLGTPDPKALTALRWSRLFVGGRTLQDLAETVVTYLDVASRIFQQVKQHAQPQSAIRVLWNPTQLL
jgi:hypothetical protein